MATAEELVDSYINGNISYVKKELKKAKKTKVLEFANILTHEFGDRYGIDKTIQMVNG